MKFRAKIAFTLAFFCLLARPGHTQNMESTIKVQAMAMANALINHDINGFIKFLPPQVIEFAGGRELLIKKMDSASIRLQQFGASFKKIIIGNPGKIISYKGLLQCVVPQSTDMETILGSLYAETYLIAISTDKGKSWFFIDTNVYKVDKLKYSMPGLSPDLLIPPQQAPKFIPKKTN